MPKRLCERTLRQAAPARHPLLARREAAPARRRLYEQIDRGIRLWDKFLLCCSEHSLKPASWVDKEIITALEKEDELTRQRGEKVRALDPAQPRRLHLQRCWKSGYRAEIRRRLAADFTGWETDSGKFEAQVENVIRALRADEAAREKPPKTRL